MQINRIQLSGKLSALWDLCETSSAWDNIPTDVGDDGGEGIAEMYRRINQTSKEAIPAREWSRFFPKPWLSEEVKQSKEKSSYIKPTGGISPMQI